MNPGPLTGPQLPLTGSPPPLTGSQLSPCRRPRGFSAVLTTLFRHALAPAEMQRLSNSAPFALGATKATDMWLAEQIASTLTKECEQCKSDLLRLTESINRAVRGKILIRPNSKTPAQFEKTKFPAGIRTRAQFQELITKSYHPQPSKNLSPKYPKSRTSYVRQWENMMREGFGANP